MEEGFQLDGRVAFTGDGPRRTFGVWRKTETDERVVLVPNTALADEPLLEWTRYLLTVKTDEGLIVPLLRWDEHVTAEGQVRR